MRSQIVQEITDLLNQINDTGKVDMSILDNIDKLSEFLNEIKSKWLEHSNTDAFYFYLAARNIELILDRMKDRFRNSKITNDYFQIIKESLVLMPVIDDVLKMTQTSDISEASINSILDKTNTMRGVAANTNLIESLEININSIDKDSFKSHFTQLVDNLK